MEWLKEILGESYTEEIEKAVSTKIGKDFVSRNDFNAKNEKVKVLEGQIAQRDEQLENLKKVDAEGLQAQIAKLQQENADKKAEYERNLEKVQFEHALDNSLLIAILIVVFGLIFLFAAPVPPEGDIVASNRGEGVG